VIGAETQDDFDPASFGASACHCGRIAPSTSITLMNQLCMQMLYNGYCLTVEPHHKVELMQDDARLDAVGLAPMLFAAPYLADAIQRNCPEALDTFIQAQGLMKMRLVGPT